MISTSYLFEGWWKDQNKGVIGDIPADIMGDSLDKIDAEYKRKWKRKPTNQELEQVFKFVMGGRK